MRNRIKWLGCFLVVAFALVAVAVAEPQDKKGSRGPGDPGGPGGGFPGGKGGFKGGKGDGFKGGKGKGPGANINDAVERILSFDKDKDGKITKEELHERRQDLIAKGDTNNDGALDRDEIQKLVASQQGPGFGGFGGPPGKGKGKGFGGPGGFPGKGFGPGGPGGIDRALADLNLTGTTKEKAEATVKTHQDNVRRLMEMARSDLLLKMKDVLSEPEFGTFKEALDRQPGPPPALAARSAELERRLDQLQKQVEDLRRELRR